MFHMDREKRGARISNSRASKKKKYIYPSVSDTDYFAKTAYFHAVLAIRSLTLEIILWSQENVIYNVLLPCIGYTCWPQSNLRSKGSMFIYIVADNTVITLFQTVNSATVLLKYIVSKDLLSAKFHNVHATAICVAKYSTREYVLIFNSQ